MLRVQNALCSDDRLEVDLATSSTRMAYEKGPETLSQPQDLPYRVSVQNTFINLDDEPGTPAALPLQRFRTWPSSTHHCQPEPQLPAAPLECFAVADDFEANILPPSPPSMVMADLEIFTDKLQLPAMAPLERWKSWKTDDPFEADVSPLPETGIAMPGIASCQLDLHPPTSVPFMCTTTADLFEPCQSACGMPEMQLSSLSAAPIMHVPTLVLFQPASFDLTQPEDARMPAPAENVEQPLAQVPGSVSLRPTPGLQLVHCETAGTLRSVHWTVDARLLTSSDREKASDSFDVSFGIRTVKFRMFLRASKVKDQRGGSCFRKAKGRGEVVLTLVDEKSPPPGELIFSISVGSTASHMRHDFSEKKSASYHEEFSFRDAEDKASQTFNVHLQLIATPQAAP